MPFAVRHIELCTVMHSLCMNMLCVSVYMQLLVKNLQFDDGKMIAASQYFKAASSTAVELTEEEKSFAEQMRVRH